MKKIIVSSLILSLACVFCFASSDPIAPLALDTAVSSTELSLDLSGLTTHLDCGFSSEKPELASLTTSFDQNATTINIALDTSDDLSLKTQATTFYLWYVIKAYNLNANMDLSFSKLVNGDSKIAYTLKATQLEDDRSGTIIPGLPTDINSAEAKAFSDDNPVSFNLFENKEADQLSKGIITLTIPSFTIQDVSQAIYKGTVTVTATIV